MPAPVNPPPITLHWDAREVSLNRQESEQLASLRAERDRHIAVYNEQWKVLFEEAYRRSNQKRIGSSEEPVLVPAE